MLNLKVQVVRVAPNEINTLLVELAQGLDSKQLKRKLIFLETF
jgi:hypothetical protein